MTFQNHNALKWFFAVVLVALLFAVGTPLYAAAGDMRDAPAAPPESGDENTVPDALPESGDENTVPDAPPESGDENTVPDALPESGDENTVPDAPPESGDENTVPDALPDETELDGGQSSAIPAFTAELVLNFDGWGLFGELSEITEDMTRIIPCFSFDGTEFTPEDYNAWQVDAAHPALRQQCFWPMESPLLEYLAKEIDHFDVKLQIVYTDGTEAFTEAVHFARTGPAPLPGDYQVAAWYGPTVLDLARNRGQYHFTIPDTMATEELTALLPRIVPVELQIYREGDPTRHTAVVDYRVTWPDMQPLSGTGDMEVHAITVTPPEEYTVTIGTEVYQLAPPEILPGNCADLCATFHPIAAGTACEVLLSTDEDTENHGVRATFPHKPTGAKRIIPEYSLDGESGWTALDDVLTTAPLESIPPRFEGYTVRVLHGDGAPLTDLANGRISSFFVRLRVEGGVLSGTTQAAVWPADYDYVPPRDDSKDDGSGGNENNVGSGNNGDEGNSNGGYHPSVPEENRPSVPPQPPNPVPTAEPEQPVVPKPSIPQESFTGLEPPIVPAPTAEPQPPIPWEPSKESQIPVNSGGTEASQPKVTEPQVVIPDTQQEPGHPAQDGGDTVRPTINTLSETDLAPSGTEKETRDGLPTGLAVGVVLSGTAGIIAAAGSAKGAAAVTGTISKRLAAIKKIFLHK